MALDAALTETDYLSVDWDEEHESFTEGLLKGSGAVRRQWKPTVYAELAMIMAMVNGEIKHMESFETPI